MRKLDRLAKIFLGGAAILGLAVVWFSSNFFYSLFWAWMEGWHLKEADVIAYTLAHLVPFILTISIVGIFYFIVRREMAKGVVAPPPASSPPPPAAQALHPENVPVKTNFASALNVHKMWLQMPRLSNFLIHINIDFFNGNGEDIYLKGINGHITVRSKGQNDAQLKPLGNLITPSFSETRRTHVPAHEPFSFILTQSVPEKFAEALSNWNKDVEYVLDFEALNVIVQSTNDPDRAARLPLWEAGSLKRRNGEVIMTQIINLRPGARGLSQFGLIQTPSPRKEDNDH